MSGWPSTGRAFPGDQLPAQASYVAEAGLQLIGRGEWRSLGPFYPDTHRALHVTLETGSCRCMANGRRQAGRHLATGWS